MTKRSIYYMGWNDSYKGHDRRKDMSSFASYKRGYADGLKARGEFIRRQLRLKRTGKR